MGQRYRLWASAIVGAIGLGGAFDSIATGRPGNDAVHAESGALGTVDNRFPAKVVIGDVSNLIQIPRTRQATDYTCGVAALQSILFFYDRDHEFREDELAVTLGADPNDGTRYGRIASFAQSLGYQVRTYLDMSLQELKRQIDLKHPVLVLLQAWPDEPVEDWKNDWVDGHYAVAIGYDNRNIYFMDPSTLGTYTSIPKDEFLDRWHDVDGTDRVNHFGMVITKVINHFNGNLITPLE